MSRRILIVSIAVVVSAAITAFGGWILLKLGVLNDRQFEFMLWIAVVIGVLAGLSKMR